jgi:hypothetical protein
MTVIKKFGFYAIILSLPFLLLDNLTSAQKLQEEAVAVNIEVPVRVFKEDTFIDNLTINDFEIFEDGVLQKIEAVYLINKTDIKREESELPRETARKVYSPKVARHFVMLFVVTDYLPKLGEAVDHFFDHVFFPEDSLTLITPLKTYKIRGDALKKLGKAEIARQMKSKLQKDIKLANTEYKQLVKEIENNYIKRGAFEWVGSDNKVIIRDFLEELENLRVVDEKRLLTFSEFLKNKEGQKNIFMFYQKEMLPKYNPFLENYFTSGNPAENPAVVFEILELTSFYRREITFDVKKIKQIFSDSSTHIHFLFLTKTPLQNLDVTRMEALSHHHIRYEEQSEDIYNAFNEVAAATGGYVGSSQNTAAIFQKAVEASDNYYLLYYSPRDYKNDGKFKSIKVKVKGHSFRILHRAGYLAD